MCIRDSSAAAAPWTTSFAVSGDDGERMPQTREPATVVTLKQNVPTVVRIPLSPDGVHDARDKVLIENQRQGCGINGTYGSFYAGAGAQTVGKILRDAADGTPTSISLTYAGRAQDGVVTIFGAKIEGSAPDLQLLRDTTRTERAMAVIKAYLDRAWSRRTVELPSTIRSLPNSQRCSVKRMSESTSRATPSCTTTSLCGTRFR